MDRVPQDVIVNFIKIRPFNYYVVSMVCYEEENKNNNDIILYHQEVIGYLVA